MICLYQLLLAARWCLVYWPKDEAVSVVRECDVISPRKEELSKGVYCKVKAQRKVYDGKLLEIDKHIIIIKYIYIILILIY